MAANKNTMISNVVPYDVLRTVQLYTLTALRDAIINSFGPKGSNTMILKENMWPKYTKDGHDILEAVHFNNGIEQSVKENLLNLTARIVKEVGDGTTSAVILSSIIFEGLCFGGLETNLKPFQIVDYFKEVTEKISKEIEAAGKECTLEDIYNIAMISSNSNKEVANNIVDIYKEHGMDVFIDVFASMGNESFLKVMDGMTLPTGMMDTCFINKGAGNTATSYIRNPYIYLFEDPVDTPEMMSFFDAILKNNIINPMTSGTRQYIPTVILAPKLSKDSSAYIDKIVAMMNELDNGNKPPLLIVSDIYDSDRYTDIALMCGCKTIKKYIDPRLQEKDIADGLAPTPDTVYQFFGRAELVESTDEFTKFVNPGAMIDAEGNYTEEYQNLLASLEGRLSRAELDGADLAEIGKLKRRINSLKCNLVEYYVGGISMADRETLRASVEDTVKNCRSAAQYGVGYAANFEGVMASRKVYEDLAAAEGIEAERMLPIAKLIAEAYEVLLNILYMSSVDAVGDTSAFVSEMVRESIEDWKMPINLNTMSYDGKVLSSIQSDIIILDTIAKIVTLMYTCNQCIMPTAYHNIYVEPRRYDGKGLYDDATPVSTAVDTTPTNHMDLFANAFAAAEPAPEYIPDGDVIDVVPETYEQSDNTFSGDIEVVDAIAEEPEEVK